MATPELVMRTDPTPAEIDFLEDRLYEFNSQATGSSMRWVSLCSVAMLEVR